MERRKLTKEDIDKVRNIEGFPIAKDEDIIALSDAPYYTACPNPFIEEFIKENGTPYDEATDDYHREPFAADVSEGKNDPVYMAHSYHTKVPYKAIMKYIEHFTKPGDIVFDGFCGTGMTGVAAEMCGQNSHQYALFADDSSSAFGSRKAILNDLSPAATFIAYNYNTPVDAYEFYKEAKRVLDECEEEYGWLYETYAVDDNGLPIKDVAGKNLKGKINYTVLSDVMICPSCSKDFVYWDVAIDKTTGNIGNSFSCPHCHAKLKKTMCERKKETFIDKVLGYPVSQPQKVPVLVSYFSDGKKKTKKPDKYDFELLEKAKYEPLKYWVPNVPMMNKGSEWGDTWRAGLHQGITHVHQFFTDKNLLVLSALFRKAEESTYSRQLKWLYTSVLIKTASKLHNIGIKKGKINLAGQMPNSLYISSSIAERNLFELLAGKLEDLMPVFNIKKDRDVIINCGDAGHLENIPGNSVDYIFTDPPFGDNLMYSELSFIWEAWLKTITDNTNEAIMAPSQNKTINEYTSLMTNSFCEYYRILKPNRWMTVEFHNSRNAVWNALQTSLQKAGFIVSDVRTIDKQQGSKNQMTTSSAVQQDLVISAYKPRDSFVQEFVNKAGSEQTVWSFINQHLSNLPVVVVKNGRIEINTERQAFLLFDRMIAYHIIKGITVPIDASDFYKGLDEKYLKRDGMYFLPDQVNEYDTARIVNDIEPIQFSFIVSNEKTAISWLYQQLDTPQTYAEIQPKFMQEIKTVDKFEAMPELSVLLEENFLQDEKGKWYVPDVTKEADVAKLREKNLLKEFESYLMTKGKLKLFRIEAVRVGFAKLWKDKNYKLIVETAERLPEQIIQEDDKLLMYYDISLGRV